MEWGIISHASQMLLCSVLDTQIGCPNSFKVHSLGGALYMVVRQPDIEERAQLPVGV